MNKHEIAVAGLEWKGAPRRLQWYVAYNCGVFVRTAWRGGRLPPNVLGMEGVFHRRLWF